MRTFVFFESLSKLLLCGYLLDMGKRSFISPKGHFKLRDRENCIYIHISLSRKFKCLMNIMLIFANVQCKLTIRNYSAISIDKFVRVVKN